VDDEVEAALRWVQTNQVWRGLACQVWCRACDRSWLEDQLGEAALRWVQTKQVRGKLPKGVEVDSVEQII